jgi:hypothetical protein
MGFRHEDATVVRELLADKAVADCVVSKILIGQI